MCPKTWEGEQFVLVQKGEGHTECGRLAVQSRPMTMSLVLGKSLTGLKKIPTNSSASFPPGPSQMVALKMN